MLLTVAHFDFPYQAQIARAQLEAEGIDAWVADEFTIGMQWLYSNALGGVRLQVDAQQLQRAQEILAQDRSQDVEEQEGSEPLICLLWQPPDPLPAGGPQAGFSGVSGARLPAVPGAKRRVLQ